MVLEGRVLHFLRYLEADQFSSWEPFLFHAVLRHFDPVSDSSEDVFG